MDHAKIYALVERDTCKGEFEFQLQSQSRRCGNKYVELHAPLYGRAEWEARWGYAADSHARFTTVHLDCHGAAMLATIGQVRMYTGEQIAGKVKFHDQKGDKVRTDLGVLHNLLHGSVISAARLKVRNSDGNAIRQGN